MRLLTIKRMLNKNVKVDWLELLAKNFPEILNLGMYEYRVSNVCVDFSPADARAGYFENIVSSFRYSPGMFE